MGKYSTSSRQAARPKRAGLPSPVRAIGCLLFVLIPIVAFEIAKYLASGPAQGWGFIPGDWFRAPELHPVLANLRGIRIAWAFLMNNIPFTIANIIFTLVMCIVIFGIMAIIYGYLHAMLAPSRYGPTDVPPPRVKTKKYTR
jgi:hypothetical protein